MEQESNVTGTIVRDRCAWLAERRNGVGASEAAAALGVSPFESPRGLYLRKLGLLPEVEETEAMRWGTLLEPVIAREYERRTGNAVVAQQLFIRSPDTPMMATVDGMTAAGYPVEFKAVSAWSGRELGEEETDQLPDHWLLQAHQQMLLTSTWRADFAVLVAGQRFRVFTVQRDEFLMEALILGVRGFWRCVETREAPALDTKADAGVMRALYPGCEGEISLGEDVAAIVDEYEAHGREAREAEADRRECRTWLLEQLGNHAIGRLPDGRVISRKVIAMKPKTIEIKGFEYVRLDVRKGAGR